MAYESHKLDVNYSIRFNKAQRKALDEIVEWHQEQNPLDPPSAGKVLRTLLMREYKLIQALKDNGNEAVRESDVA